MERSYLKRELSVPPTSFNARKLSADPETAAGGARLRVLGGLDLRDHAGRELRSVMAQPKRVGLLSFLAASDPECPFRRRDQLLGLLWPSLDNEHARSALRVSLYRLRRALGSNVVLGRGDEEVGLNCRRFQSDIIDFQRLTASGDCAAALDLYRGDLLEGFFLPGAPDFERWVDDQRTRLRSMAVNTAWTLVRELETRQPEAAVGWARRALSLDPDDERGLRRLLSLLDRLGDRAGALRTFVKFGERMRVEFGLGPAPETVSMVDAIRRRCDTPTG